MPSATRRPLVVIGVLAACGLAVSLMQTLVVPLLPRFPELLHASPATVTWLVTATLVAGAVAAPLLGRLGDMYGKRRMLLVALSLVVVGSTLGAVAPDVGTLIVARTFQGASLGVIPLGISAMRDVLPPKHVGASIALMSSSLGIGGAVGLPLTGFVAQEASWRWLFAGCALLTVLLMVALARFVPESPQRSGGRFDLPGAAGLAAALVCLLLAISKGSEWGWTSGPVLGLLVAAVTLFAAWGAWELRTSAPLVDLRVSARPAVLWTNVASVLVGFSMFAGFLVSTQVLQAPVDTGYGFGLSLVAAGLVMLPIGGAMTIFSPVSARLSRARGARTTILLGVALLAVGNLGMALLPHSIALVMVAATVTATGAALTYSAIPLIIMDAVPMTETASANSLNALMRMLGTSSCSAVVAAISAGMVSDVGGHALPSGAAYAVIYGAAAAAAVAGGLVVAFTRAGQPASVPAGVAAAEPVAA